MKFVQLLVLGLVVWAAVGMAQDGKVDCLDEDAAKCSRHGEVGCLDQQAIKCVQQGRFELAVQKWEEARSKLIPKTCLSQDYTNVSVDSAQRYIDISLDQAAAYQSSGRLQNALDVLKCAESVTKEKIGDKSAYFANVLSQFADVYLAIGNAEYKNCQFTGKYRHFARQENLKAALNYVQEAMNIIEPMDIVEKSSDPLLKLLEANILNKKGNILVVQEKYDGAVQEYQKGAKYADQDTDQSKLLKTKMLINIAHARAGNALNTEILKDVEAAKKAIEDARKQVMGGLPAFYQHEKLFSLTSLAYLVQKLRSKFPLEEDLSLNNLLESNLKDSQRDAVAFAKSYLAKSYADFIMENCSSKEKPGEEKPGCRESDMSKSVEFIKQAIHEIQSCPLSSPDTKITELDNVVLKGLTVYLPSSHDGISKEQCQEECRAICGKDYLSPCKQDRTSPCKTSEELKKTLPAECKGNCKEIPSLFPNGNGICGKMSSSFLQGDHPEWLFNLQWQLGRIYKAQQRWEEAFCPYERAATYLQLVQNTYAYPSVSQTFRESKEAFYLDRADLLLQAAKNDEQNLLKAAIDSIESRQETELQNYFQDECVTQKSPEVEEKQLQEGEALFYPIVFDDRIELVLKFSDDSIKRKVSLLPSKELELQINTLRNELVSPNNEKLPVWVESSAKKTL